MAFYESEASFHDPGADTKELDCVRLGYVWCGRQWQQLAKMNVSRWVAFCTTLTSFNTHRSVLAASSMML